MSKHTQSSVANALFHNSRNCPYCRLKGRGKWGQFTREDRAYYGVKSISLNCVQRVAFAVRMAVSTFFDSLRTPDMICTIVHK